MDWMYWMFVLLWLWFGFAMQTWMLFKFVTSNELRVEVKRGFLALGYNQRLMYILIFTTLPVVWPVVLVDMATSD